MRRDVLLNPVKIGSYIGSDRNLLADLALRGRIVHIPSVQFLSRDHRERSVRAIHPSKRGPWFDTANPASGKYWLSRCLEEHAKLLFRQPLAFGDRVRGLIALGDWALRNRREIRHEILLIPGLSWLTNRLVRKQL